MTANVIQKNTRAILRRARSTGLLFLFLSALVLDSCTHREQPSDKGAGPTASVPSSSTSSKNANQSSLPENAVGSGAASKEATGSATPKSNAPAQLIGEYEVREIEDKGVVTMVSSIQTKIYFLADGSYSRTSKKDGRTYHSDSGRFRIEPPDKLVLTIMVSGSGPQQTIQKPPLEKVHKFTLSSDGEELKLTSGKGSAALFRRVARPKAG
ncbi:MAG TPA: hypothetical protein VLM38_02185 [Blastocatellia bacterium]|nr:hypothetical protein [Blastocatellia bacterium]